MFVQKNLHPILSDESYLILVLKKTSLVAKISAVNVRTASQRFCKERFKFKSFFLSISSIDTGRLSILRLHSETKPSLPLFSKCLWQDSYP
jgi:hypothetical protein